MLKIYLIISSCLTAVIPYTFAYFAYDKAYSDGDKDEVILLPAVIGGCIILWPLLVILASYWFLNIVLFYVGNHHAIIHKKQKVAKEEKEALALSVKLKQEAKRKQEKLWAKVGD